MRRLFLFQLLLIVGIVMLASPAFAQRERPRPRHRAGGMQERGPAPRIVTVIHRLDGLKVMNMISRSGRQVYQVDERLLLNKDLHRTITAGFAFGRGNIVVARLPLAAAGFELSLSSRGNEVTVTSNVTVREPAAQAESQPAELLVMEADGTTRTARYVGLDGPTGLSVLSLANGGGGERAEIDTTPVSGGAILKIVAPDLDEDLSRTMQGSIAVRLKPVEGRLRLLPKVSSFYRAQLVDGARPELPQFAIGGVAVDGNGSPVGIVENGSGDQVQILPARAISDAVRRVLGRGASVPRPWLGIRGETVTELSSSALVRGGWSQDESRAILQRQRGIYITSVPSGTPAGIAGLRAGDVIVRAGDAELKSFDELTASIYRAGVGGVVALHVTRPGKAVPLTIDVTLEASLDPVADFERMEAESRFKREIVRYQTEMAALSNQIQLQVELKNRLSVAVTGAAPNPEVQARIKQAEATLNDLELKLAEMKAVSLRTEIADFLSGFGIGAVPIGRVKPAHPGSLDAMFVFSVRPASRAARAGVQKGDVISSVNGHLLNAIYDSAVVLRQAGQPGRLGLTRSGENIEAEIPQR